MISHFEILELGLIAQPEFVLCPFWEVVPLCVCVFRTAFSHHLEYRSGDCGVRRSRYAGRRSQPAPGGKRRLIAKDSIDTHSSWDAGALRPESSRSVWWISWHAKENGSGRKNNLCPGGKEMTCWQGWSLVMLPGDELLHPAECHLLVEWGKRLSLCGQAEWF